MPTMLLLNLKILTKKTILYKKKRKNYKLKMAIHTRKIKKMTILKITLRQMTQSLCKKAKINSL